MFFTHFYCILFMKKYDNKSCNFPYSLNKGKSNISIAVARLESVVLLLFRLVLTLILTWTRLQFTCFWMGWCGW